MYCMSLRKNIDLFSNFVKLINNKTNIENKNLGKNAIVDQIIKPTLSIPCLK